MAAASSGDFHALRAQLLRAREANADLEKVCASIVDGLAVQQHPSHRYCLLAVFHGPMMLALRVQLAVQ